MGNVKIPYYVTRGEDGPNTHKMGYWSPLLKRQNKKSGASEPTLMATLGFEIVDLGPDGPMAWARAKMWNERWQDARRRHLAGEAPGRLERAYPPGSFGEGFAKFRKTNAWQRDKKPRTRESWERGWKYIEPVFGDVDPYSVGLEDIDLWYGGDPNDPNILGLVGTFGVGEAYHAMKIWRALWSTLCSIKREDGERYCKGGDPSLGVRRQTPKKREAFFVYDETRRLVKGAWKMGYKGLAAALAVSWDTQFSPVDARSVTKAKLSPDPNGPVFSLSRTKTGKAAIGTLSYKTERVLLHYIAGLDFELHPDTPIFHTRGADTGPKGGRPQPPAPYTKDTLSKDFRVVREAVLPGDTRKIMDFRRSGTLEAIAGQVDPHALASKMANSIDTNRALQETYKPNHVAVVRFADEARLRGREALRQAGVKKNGQGT
jgi:hypothetical protein